MPPTLASCTPADGAVLVEENAPILIELTRSDSNDKKVLETTQADFNTGTLSNVQANPTSDLTLALSSVFDDTYEGDTVGSLPAGYSDYNNGAGNVSVQVIDSQHAVRFLHSAGNVTLKRNAPAMADWDVYVDFQFASASDLEFSVRCTGTFNNRYCYRFRFHGIDQKLYIDKLINGTSTQIGIASFTFSTGTWYTGRVQAIGSALKVKAWQRSGSEPGSWGLEITDTNVTAAGVSAIGSYSAPATWVDNFRTVAVTPAYASSGYRVSPAYPLSTVGKFASAQLQWDVTLPALTSLTMKVSKDGSSWSTISASGGQIALWSDGDDLTAANLYLRMELATSDVSVSPDLLEVRAIFFPVDPSLVEIDVGGITMTVANGGLETWPSSKLASGVIVDWHQDVWLRTLKLWWRGSLDYTTLLIKYNSSTLSTKHFTSGPWQDLGKGNGLYSWWYALALGGLLGRCGYLEASYTIGGFADYLTRGEFHYFIQTPPRGEFDAYYYICHAIRTDTPGSLVVGQPVAADTPGSLVVRGWCRSDTPGSLIVQGWIREDTPASLVVAIPVAFDLAAASLVVAGNIVTDLAGSLVVSQVNDLNAIDVQVIDDIVAAMLSEVGVTVL